MESLLEGLNPPQRQAVQFKDGPLLVLAGPGSGKTRVVTHRIAHLIASGVDSRNILALTFTNKAADEMRARLETLAPGSRVWMGTFHRFCSWVLRLYIDHTPLEQNFSIYDTDECRKIVDKIVDKNKLPNGIDSAKVLAAIGRLKNDLILPNDFEPDPHSLLGAEVAKVYPKYQKALLSANAVDFDDLLVHVATLLKKTPEIRAQLDRRFRYVLVDEYQDTNQVQYSIARSLSIDYPNLAVTGDPDQSIYGWRGANIENILHFEKDFKNVTVIRLEENYRSTKRILAAASALIKHNRRRKEKELFTQNQKGQPPILLSCQDHNEEGNLIAAFIKSQIDSGRRSAGDFAIFYRINALSRILEQALRRAKVPFHLVRGLEFYNRKEVKDLIAYLRLVYNPDDALAFLRVVNFPARGIGRVTLERLDQFAIENQFSLLRAARYADKIPKISRRAAVSLKEFVALIDTLTELDREDTDLEVILSVLLQKTQYEAPLRGSTLEEDQQRLANIQELLTDTREFDRVYNEEPSDEELSDAEFRAGRLGRFLEQVALASDVDDLDKSDRVSLMSLHAAKGLEFPVVFIIAVEDNILPHERSKKLTPQLEEERRLLFVGMTRAQEELYLSRARFREFRGTYTCTIVSPFLYEIPETLREERDARTFQEEEGIDLTGNDTGSDTVDDSIDDSVSDTVSEALQDIPVPGLSVPVNPPRVRRSRSRSRERVISEEDNRRVVADEYCEYCQEPSREDRFSETGDGRAAPPKKKQVLPALPGVCVAADLIDPSERSSNTSSQGKDVRKNDLKKKVSRGAFVNHDQFGVGSVRSVDGSGDDAILTVQFCSSAGRVEVFLSDPALHVLSSGGISR